MYVCIRFEFEIYICICSNGISFDGTNLILMVSWLSQAPSYLKGLSDTRCMLFLVGDFSHTSITAETLTGILFYQLFIISSYHYGYVEMEAVVF